MLFLTKKVIRMKKRYALAVACLCVAGVQRASALEQSDGIYQIGNALDLIDFAGVVNGGTLFGPGCDYGRH